MASMRLALTGAEPVQQSGLGQVILRGKGTEVQQALDDYQAGRFGVIPPGALMPYRA